ASSSRRAARLGETGRPGGCGLHVTARRAARHRGAGGDANAAGMGHEGRADVRATTVSTSLLTLAFFAPVAAGCLSHEYVIPKSELVRIASLPADVRGARVHAVQALGE